MKIDTQRDQEKVVFVLEGDLDVYATPILQEAVEKAADESVKEVVIDMGRVKYIDSSGLGTLVGILKSTKKNGAMLHLRRLQPDVRKIFELTRLIRFFDILD